jgi:hypothetical protein
MVIIIEIDENQHINYTCEDERMKMILEDLGYRPVLFIRFNPDSYIENNKNYSSCWKIGNKGICIIPNNKKKEWEERLTKLKNEILYWINPENKIKNLLEVIYLFFDK